MATVTLVGEPHGVFLEACRQVQFQQLLGFFVEAADNDRHLIQKRWKETPIAYCTFVRNSSVNPT